MKKKHIPLWLKDLGANEIIHIELYILSLSCFVIEKLLSTTCLSSGGNKKL